MDKKIRLAIAPIGWTNDDMPELGGEIPFEQCISEMALAGFEGSEVGNKYPRDPEKLNKALALRRLTICNAWFSSFLTTKPLEEVEREFVEQCNFLYAVGARVIGAAEQGNSIQGKRCPYSMQSPVSPKTSGNASPTGSTTSAPSQSKRACSSRTTTTWAPVFRPAKKSTA